MTLTSKWTNRFTDMARLLASWSKDPSTKVGCVIVDSSLRVRSTGYNGFPRGVADAAERLENRETKHLFTVHAEANAVAAAARHGVSLFECTAVVTHPPCGQCAALLVQSGVSEVIWLENSLHPSWEATVQVAKHIFNEARVKFITVRENSPGETS